MPGSLIDDIKRLLDAAPATRPWQITERSSPGWRVESFDGKLVCFGPEELFTADNGRLITLAPTYLEVLVSELETRDFQIELQADHIAALHEEVVALRIIKERLEEIANSPLDGSAAAEVAWCLENPLTI